MNASCDYLVFIIVWYLKMQCDPRCDPCELFKEIRMNKIIKMLFVFASIFFIFFGVLAYSQATVTEQSLQTDTSKKMNVFFILQAKDSNLERLKDGDYLLTAKDKNVATHTLMVAERPNRLAEQILTSNFYQYVQQGSDNFKVNPPNIVISWKNTFNRVPVAFELKKFKKNAHDSIYLLGLLPRQQHLSRLTQGNITIYIDQATMCCNADGFCGSGFLFCGIPSGI